MAKRVAAAGAAATLALLARLPSRSIGCSRPTCRGSARSFGPRGRQRRAAADAVHRARRHLAAARHGRSGRCALSADARRLRGQALRQPLGRRSARPRARARPVGEGGARRLRRLDADHADRPPAGAAPAHHRRQADRDGARAPARMALRQARDPRHVPDAGALWRQSRGRARGVAVLLRQGAGPADRRRGGAAGGAAAVAGSAPARPPRRRRAGRPRPRPGAHGGHRTPQRTGRRRGRGAAGPGGAAPGRASGRPSGRAAARRRPGIAAHSHHHRRRPADAARSLGAALSAEAGAGRHDRPAGGRERRAQGARLCRLRRLLRQRPARPERPRAGRALAGLDPEAVHLRPRLRRSPHPSRDHRRRPPRCASATMRPRISTSATAAS